MAKFAHLIGSGRYGGTIEVNIDDISSLKEDYDGYRTSYVVSMKNGDKHYIERYSYEELKKQL